MDYKSGMTWEVKLKNGASVDRAIPSLGRNKWSMWHPCHHLGLLMERKGRTKRKEGREGGMEGRKEGREGDGEEGREGRREGRGRRKVGS